MNQYEISVQEFEDNMEFCVDLCARERIVWKIRRESGEYVMCVPVTERAAPVELTFSACRRVQAIIYGAKCDLKHESMEMLFHAKWNLPKAAKNANLTDKE